MRKSTNFHTPLHGYPADTNYSYPLTVPKQIKAISVGEGDFILALNTDGTVSGYGPNSQMERGLAIPPGLTGVQDVSAGMPTI